MIFVLLRSPRQSDCLFNLGCRIRIKLLRELEKRSRLVLLADCHYSIGRTDGLRFVKNHGAHQRGI